MNDTIQAGTLQQLVLIKAGPNFIPINLFDIK